MAEEALGAIRTVIAFGGQNKELERSGSFFVSWFKESTFPWFCSFFCGMCLLLSLSWWSPSPYDRSICRHWLWLVILPCSTDSSRGPMMPRGLLPSIIFLTAQKETCRVPKPSIKYSYPRYCLLSHPLSGNELEYRREKSEMWISWSQPRIFCGAGRTGHSSPPPIWLSVSVPEALLYDHVLEDTSNCLKNTTTPTEAVSLR